MTLIKICGLRSLDDVAIVNDYKPDYIGFIFVQGRTRYIEPKVARELKDNLDKSIKAVGVYINEEVLEVARMANEDLIDVIQLHGTEDEDYITKLRSLTKKPIIKAIRIESEKDLEKARACMADIVLLDRGIGGTGQQFDWNLLEKFERPFFLAGGLDENNVKEAIERFHPLGLDVSSNVESEGKKDREKVERFINQVRKEDKNYD